MFPLPLERKSIKGSSGSNRKRIRTKRKSVGTKRKSIATERILIGIKRISRGTKRERKKKQKDIKRIPIGTKRKSINQKTINGEPQLLYQEINRNQNWFKGKSIGTKRNNNFISICDFNNYIN